MHTGMLFYSILTTCKYVRLEHIMQLDAKHFLQKCERSCFDRVRPSWGHVPHTSVPFTVSGERQNW